MASTAMTGTTVLHPSTYLPTKIVHSPVGTVAQGVRATSRLVRELPLQGSSKPGR